MVDECIINCVLICLVFGRWRLLSLGQVARLPARRCSSLSGCFFSFFWTLFSLSTQAGYRARIHMAAKICLISSHLRLKAAFAVKFGTRLAYIKTPKSGHSRQNLCIFVMTIDSMYKASRENRFTHKKKRRVKSRSINKFRTFSSQTKAYQHFFSGLLGCWLPSHRKKIKIRLCCLLRAKTQTPLLDSRSAAACWT